MATVKDILAIARKELGTKESPANSNNVKYNTWFYGHAVRDTEKAVCPQGRGLLLTREQA